MDPDDRDLLQRIQGGDGESFGLLFDRTHRWLLQMVIVPRVGRADAQDVLADTFRAALGSIGRFRWQGVGLLHWLAAIARRKCLEHARRDARNLEPLDERPALLELPDDVPTAEAEMIRAEGQRMTRERVASTLAKLHPRYAEALRLRLVEERTRDECARRLEVSTATFDVVLYRATKAFAREWNRP